MSRPSGLPIIEDGASPLTTAVAVIEKRGRLNILPRWRNRVSWLAATQGHDVEALMIFPEAGLISIHSWDPEGPKIKERFAELLNSTDPEAKEALRIILDRYQRLIIPMKDRPSLGDGALAHLGLPIDRRARSIVYVTVFTDHIEVMSTSYRDTRLAGGHELIDDLP